MKQLNPYLMFPGTCKDALEFYKECFGGEILAMQTFAESPLDVADEQKDMIFNSVFKADYAVFMASDILPDNPITPGNNFSLFMNFTEESELQDAFEKISAEGQVIMPLQGNFGMVMDKFNVQWMLSLSQAEQQ